MKKLFVLIAVLALWTGIAFAADLNGLMTAEYAADTTGRTVVSGDSVLFTVWNTNPSLNAQVSVSSDTVMMFYENNVAVLDNRFGAISTSSQNGFDTTVPSCNTVGGIVNTINKDSSGYWHAQVGPDAYPGMVSQFLLGNGGQSTAGLVGTTSQTAYSIKLASTDAKFITCGVSNDNTGAIDRIKYLTHRVSGTGTVTARIYDGGTASGGTVIWRQDIGRVAYNNVSNNTVTASPVTVNFANLTYGKGLAGSRNGELVLRVDSTTICTDSSNNNSDNNLAIGYDQIRK